MLQLIYELRKNCCGRVDGWTGGIEGSTRGPRGSKNQFCDPTQRSYLGLRSSGIVLQIASIGVVFNPGNLVLPHRADGILHRLVHNRVHRRNKEVQGCQQLLSILCQVSLSICNSTFCLTSGRRKDQKDKLNPKKSSYDSCFLSCG